MSIKKYIPDFITSMNVVCGIIGVVFAFKGRFEYAFYLMLAAAVFDFLDGFFARLLGAYSDLGKELDSLCDIVSFGVLPSVMLYKLMCTQMFAESVYCWIPLVMTVFSALRLAKFNVDKRQSDSFLGLPVPASALLCGSLCYYICHTPASFLSDWAAGPVFLPLLPVVLSVLMVSEIPMFSLKFHKGDSRVVKVKRLAFAALAVLSAVICLLCSLNWSMALVMTLACYILKNIIYAIVKI